MQLQKATQEHCSTFAQTCRYQGFVAGSCPKTLLPVTPGKQYRLGFPQTSVEESRSSITKAIDVARSAEKAQCVWLVGEGESKKWARPCGVAIVSLGQIVFPPGVPQHLV